MLKILVENNKTKQLTEVSLESDSTEKEEHFDDIEDDDDDSLVLERKKNKEKI